MQVPGAEVGTVEEDSFKIDENLQAKQEQFLKTMGHKFQKFKRK